MRKRLLALFVTMCLLINITPTVFATEQNTSDYSGKTISVLGDSISTFTGYIPDGYRTRYPDRSQGSGVDTVYDTWWMQLINELDAKLGINDSWAGSTVSNIYDEDQTDNKKGPTRAMASWTRINNLGANDTPDVILFYGGTNDCNAVYRDSVYEMGTFDLDNAPNFNDYDPATDTAIKWDTVVDAFVAAILRMKATYPNAEIFALLPINGSANGFNTEIKKIYEHYEIPTVSLDSVGSTGVWDDLHPNAYGMDIITAEVKAVMTNTEVVLPEHPTVTDLLQEIPADAYSDTNLWEKLSPIHEYYGASNWDSDYDSIIFPVKEGDQIYASSFQDKVLNGNPNKGGIRVTYFKGDAVEKTIAPADVYNEFKVNEYLTVPADVDAVCVPMWKNDNNSVVKLLTLPTRIDEVELTIPVPVTGQIPTTEISGTNYSGTITWSPDVSNTFAAGVDYTATISLTAADGYKFALDYTASVNGTAAEVDNNGIISYTFPTTENAVIKAGHVQWLADDSDIYSDTNLWRELNPENEYYGSNGWGNTNYKSITIPVREGDKIYASSFQSSDVTGGTSNGIRVTYFNDDEVVNSIKPADVYSEFTSNNGYIVVPAGVNAVCIPMWNDDDKSVVNLLTRPTRSSYVAYIDTKGYETLAAAVAEAGENDTIVLNSPIALSEAIEISGKPVTIDLNEQIVTATSSVFLLKNGAELNLSNGTINATGDDSIVVWSTGNGTTANEINLDDVVLTADTFVVYHNGLKYGANVNIKDSTLTSDDIVAVYLAGRATVDASWPEGKNNTLVIEGSEITGTSAVEVKRGDVTVKEGSELTASETQASIDGNKNGPASTGYALALTSNKGTAVGSATVEGGNFTGKIGIEVNAGVENDATFAVSGGTFDEAVPEEYCANGYVPEDNGDGTFGVKVGSYVAYIDTKGYETLAEAVSEAGKNDTIVLNSTITLSEAIEISGKPVTIDLNEQIVTATSSVFMLKNGAELNLSNGTINATGEGVIVWSDGNGTVANTIVLDGVTLTADDYVVHHRGNYYGSDITIKDSTLTSSNGVAVYLSGLSTNGKWPEGKNNTLVIENSEITGVTAVEAKRSEVEIKAGTVLTATGAPSMTTNPSGPCTTGYALALTYSDGGTVNNPYGTVGTATVTGGTFVGKIGIEVIEGRENKAGFAISGGTFGEAVPEEYCANGYVPEDNGDGTFGVKPAVPVTDVALNKTSTTIIVGNTETLTATVTPSNATNKAVAWTSSNSAVATVSETGVVTAVASGTATITVTTTDGGKTATCTVTVNAASGGNGGSFGGGGSVSTTYSITVEDAKNGDVTVSPKSASKGDTVTVTIDPDDGYTLEALTVTDKNGKEIELTKVNSTKYTFKMPSGKVTVQATFMEDNTMLNYFVDVFASDYYYDAVLWAVENGITTGTTATTFSPNATCTRAQVVTFLWRAAGCPEPVGTANEFDDVSSNAYYAKAVQWAVEQGITLGTGDNKFSPDAECTRGQIVTFLWRAQGSENVIANNPFVDVADDAYYADAIIWAVDEAITNGTGDGTTFSPNDDCTRAQIVTFLYRCLAE